MIFGILTAMELHFAENLKQLRLERGLSQAALGKLLNVDQRTVSAWEKGACEPSMTALARMCEIFGESFDTLLL